MSGYRDSSGFDPYAYERPGRPLRPFNWVQWTGVAMGVAGALAMVATLVIRLTGREATRDDWIPLGSALVILGSVLINSRRQPGLTTATRRKRMVIVAVGLMLFGAALITILVLKGA